MALYLHNHQPVGNFEEVYEFAYTHAYLPLLKTLVKHKKLKFGLHNSGPLCDWLLNRHPEYFDLLKEAINQNQVELLISAYSEPILSLLPPEDVIDQIKYFKDYIYKLLGYEAKGLWLTERVWEPNLISILSDSGIEYTLVDDTHFKYAGLDDEELFSYYITEDCGKILKVFPISMKLRYLIPFHKIDETIEYLKEEEVKRDNALKTLGDDGEKFGVWPGTYDWVYKEHWLEDFLSRIEELDWIETVHLKDITKEPPAGRVYLPTASYEEMGEWALPLNASKDYNELKSTIDHRYYRLIHGGYFKNFLRFYPEANIMHKRMIYVSRNLPRDDLQARIYLWRGQCSCAYWHGIFGGLYLPHLREAIYKNLIEAELPYIKTGIEVRDFDIDGTQEIIVSTSEIFSVIKPQTASFIEIDDRMRKANLLNYLARRREKYHNKIIAASESEEGIKSIHEILRSKEKNLHQYLIYDRYEREFGIDHHLTQEPSQEEFYHQENIGTIIRYEGYEIDRENFIIRWQKGDKEKVARFTPGQRIIEFAYKGFTDLLGIEFSFGIFPPNLTIDGLHSLYNLQTLSGIREFSITGESYLPIKFIADIPFNLLSYPIETISSSESGFERIFQGFCLLLVFTRPPNLRINL
ncbi:MAG: alpha-amylase/4-alpha-glucanotransferase domain-containing protein [candidate division WOR-3 bacterium]